MKQEQFIRIRVKLMEQLRQGAEWSDEDSGKDRSSCIGDGKREPPDGEAERGDPKRVVLFGAKAGYSAGTSGR